MKSIAKFAAIALVAATSCQTKNSNDKEFNYVVDRFADIEVLRYKVPGFEELQPRQKALQSFRPLRYE